jgi:20S proteasome alpha/beta subunit
MTLVAAFRCRDNGILLCADREEDDGIARRPMDKLHRLAGLRDCEIWMAGSGITVTIDDAYIEADQALKKAETSDASLLTEHKAIIEESLIGTHERYKEYLRRWPLHMLIVVAPRLAGSPPILYRTDKHRLIATSVYAACGSGKTICDYFADRLYQHGLEDISLVTLAAFILREAESASGVGLGNDMALIRASIRRELYDESIKEIQAGIPLLKDAIWSYWPENVKTPEWLKKDYAAAKEE